VVKAKVRDAPPDSGFVRIAVPEPGRRTAQSPTTVGPALGFAAPSGLAASPLPGLCNPFRRCLVFSVDPHLSPARDSAGGPMEESDSCAELS
jgi:hypothetical protein